MMTSRQSVDLDRYITGNYGEDQFRGEEEVETWWEQLKARLWLLVPKGWRARWARNRWRKAWRKRWECHTKRCSYFEDYLSYGPADLTHEGYHAAERKCAFWQDRAQKWLDAHKDSDLEFPAYIERECEKWEKRIRC